MSQRTFLNGPVIKVLALTAALLGFALTLYFMAGLPSPREADRLTTFDRTLSIIPPKASGWSSSVLYGPPNVNFISQIEILHSGMVGVPESLKASRYRNPVEQETLTKADFVPATFQDQPAWIRARKEKRNYVWRVVFQRHGQWYDITLTLQREENVPQSGWWPFINSFQANPAPASTTAPATAPGTLMPTSLMID